MQKKKGISLIVLVITIIVMIILAASVVITLSNTGVIDRASEAVDATNESQVQDLAALIWADAYMGGKRGTELETEVTTKLSEEGITTDKWNISVTDTGVSVTNKNNSATTLSSLIKGPEDYGKTVDYSVTTEVTLYSIDDNTGNAVETKETVTVSDWQIYYHNEDYVYLIAKNSIGYSTLNNGTTVSSLTSDELSLFEKFRVGDASKCALTETISSRAVAQLIKDYVGFANKTDYGTNVVGAIGGPTLELIVAGWNAKGYDPKLTLTAASNGYMINNQGSIVVEGDGMYIKSSYTCWLASQRDDNSIFFAGADRLEVNEPSMSDGIRPVVCLKASTPATVGTTTDFSLVK